MAYAIRSTGTQGWTLLEFRVMEIEACELTLPKQGYTDATEEV